MTHPDYLDGKTLTSFAIDNIYINLDDVESLLAKIDGVTEIRRNKKFLPDIHINFLYFGAPFIVEEPHGDNSWYWIGPANSPVETVDVSFLENTFKKYKPSFFRMAIGDLMTFRFMRWFQSE